MALSVDLARRRFCKQERDGDFSTTVSSTLLALWWHWKGCFGRRWEQHVLQVRS